MAITYELLFEILRKEKNHEDLQTLSSTFHTEVANYVAEKTAKLAERPRLDDFSAVENEQTAIRNQLANIRRLIRDIFERRERKIIDMAINKAKTGSNIIDMSALLPEEQSFFQSQIGTISGFRKEILETSLIGKASPQTGLEPVQEGDKPKDLNIEPSESSDKELKKVQILESVPKFVGIDLEIYGPYNTSDEIDLHPSIAEMLVKTNKARVLEQ